MSQRGAALLAIQTPNHEALALGPTIGWLAFGCALAFAAVIVLDLERWRRFWLRSEDPRAIGLFRVVFAAAVLININVMAPQFELLFTDEGMFMTDSARQALASGPFAGYGEAAVGESEGFFDLAAFLTYLVSGKYSLLFFWDSPRAFWAQLVIFEIATLLFMVGWRSRLTGLISFVLMLGFMHRNPVFQTGADAVFRVMFVYLLLARSGHGYSVDNWLRCRRLRADGQLSERDGLGRGAGLAPSEAHPRGLAAIYRRIPAWPRTLMVLNLAAIYLWSGCAKTGWVWAAGDTLYYSLNLDHFYRVPTQYIASIFGTNAFRLMTWVVHFWQIGFSAVVLGLVVRWAIREGLEPPPGWRRVALRVAWAVIGIGAVVITAVGWAVHLPPDRLSELPMFQWGTLALGLSSVALIAWAWRRLRERPFTIKLRARTWTLDLDTFMGIFCARRFWLTLGLIFHWHIFVLMNIGMFAPIMMIVYIACLNGSEVASMFGLLGRGLSQLGIPGIPSRAAITPTEDPSLPHLHHGRFELPNRSVGVGFALAACAVLLRVAELDPWWWLTLLAAILAPAVIGASLHLMGHELETRKGREADERWAWAHGPIMRVVVGTVLTVGLTAIAAWSIPDKDCTKSFRKPARQAAGHWVRPTQTYQSWNMFAPNPPRSNSFMYTYLTDAKGQVWDLYTDANSPRNKKNPWVLYSRMGKITRRAIGRGETYQKWFGRYFCRSWARDHDGELPRQVQIVKAWYRIPPPETLRERGPYDAAARFERFGKRRVVHTTHCARERDAQLTNELRARYGLELVPDKQIHRAIRAREHSWKTRKERARRRERQAQEREVEQQPVDPELK